MHRIANLEAEMQVQILHIIIGQASSSSQINCLPGAFMVGDVFGVSLSLSL